PRSPTGLPAFPYTTLFRSTETAERDEDVAGRGELVRAADEGRVELLGVHELPHLPHRVRALVDRILDGAAVVLRRQQLRLAGERSEEHTSELQSPDHLVCR